MKSLNSAFNAQGSRTYIYSYSTHSQQKQQQQQRRLVEGVQEKKGHRKLSLA
jgi:hypothetical protein